jgi:hypothetical protein
MEDVHRDYEKVGVTVIAKDDAQVRRVKEQVQRTQDQDAKDAGKAGESVLD